MRFSDILATLAVVAATAPETLAHPGSVWKERLAEIQARAARPVDGPDDSSELLGDLVTPGASTEVGKLISDLLIGNADAQSDEFNQTPTGALGSPECQQDTCCVWTYLAQEMAQLFRGPSGRCNSYARRAVRLAFHDAGPWQKGLDHGGADGSILLSDELTTRPVNKGLEEIASVTNGWYAKYKPYGASMADIIQLGGTVATVVCPLGPRIRSFVGRVDNPAPAQDGLMPEPTMDADFLIELFDNKTIKPHGLAALVGAHTTSQQRFFNPQRALDPQDSTPGVWDVKFYGQTLDANAPKRVLKFPSDVSLSTHPRIAEEWKEFAADQSHWDDDFAKEMIRLGLLGVNNINNLTECTKVLPQATSKTFNASDSANVDKWANGGYSPKAQAFGHLLANGSTADNGTLSSNGIDPNLAIDGEGITPVDGVGREPITPAAVVPAVKSYVAKKLRALRVRRGNGNWL